MAGISGTRRFLHLAVLNGAQTALNLGTGVVSARALDPDGRGAYATVAVFAAIIATVIPLGIPQAAVAWEGPLSSVKKVLQWYAIGVLPAALCLVIALALLGVVRNSNLHAWVGGGLMAAGGAFAALATGLYQRRQEYGLGFRLIRLGPSVLMIGYMSSFWAFGVDDPSTWLLFSGIATFIPAATAFLFVLRTSLALEPARLEKQSVGPFVHAALGAAGTVLSAQVFFRVDSMVAAARLGLDQLGYYVVAFGVHSAIVAVSQAGAVLVHADLARQVRPDIRAQQVRRASKRTLLLAATLCASAITVAPVVVPLVYGPAFEGAVVASQILAIAAVPVAMDYVYLHALLVLGSPLTLTLTQGALSGVATVAALTAVQGGEAVPVAIAAAGVFGVSALTKRIQLTYVMRKLEREDQECTQVPN